MSTCEACGEKIVDHTLICGAPQCCPRCCKETNGSGEETVPLTCAAKHTCAGQAYIKAEQAAKRQEKARMATVRATSDGCHCDSCGAGGALSSFQGRLLCNQCFAATVKTAADNQRKYQAQSEAAPVGGGPIRSLRQRPQTDYRPIVKKAVKVTLAVRALRFLLSLIVRKGSSDA